MGGVLLPAPGLGFVPEGAAAAPGDAAAPRLVEQGVVGTAAGPPRCAGWAAEGSARAGVGPGWERRAQRAQRAAKPPQAAATAAAVLAPTRAVPCWAVGEPSISACGAAVRSGRGRGRRRARPRRRHLAGPVGWEGVDRAVLLSGAEIPAAGPAQAMAVASALNGSSGRQRGGDLGGESGEAGGLAPRRGVGAAPGSWQGWHSPHAHIRPGSTQTLRYATYH